MKYLIALICLALSGCNQSPASRIEKVLNKCAAISAEASRQPTPEQKIDFVTRSFQSLDTSECPEDFRVAFQSHVNAWLQFQAMSGQNTLAANFVEGFLGGFTGDTSKIGQTDGNASAANQYVNNTYFRLTEIAAAHGARVPRSVVK